MQIICRWLITAVPKTGPGTGELSLFWEKKKTVDVTLVGAHGDNRSAYRIEPDSNRPVIVNIPGNPFDVLNVSGIGVAFRAHGFPLGTSIEATIRLPSEDRLFPVV